MKRKGYFTVEASVIIPVSVFMACVLLSLGMHIFQRCWYTQTICQMVVYGSGWWNNGVEEGKQKLDQKWEVVKKECYPVPRELKGITDNTSDSMSIRVTGKTMQLNNVKLWFDIECSQKIQEPVKYIRRIKAICEMRDE